MILEFDTLLGDLAQFHERKNLEAAAIRENGSIPTHKMVQTTKMFDDLESRPNEQMVGVSEDNLRVQVAEFPWTHGLHRALRADRHERRRLDHAVPGCELTAPRFCVPILSEYVEHRREFSLADYHVNFYSHGCRAMRLLFFVLAIAGSVSVADLTVAGGDVDPKTGMKFPARIGSFQREDGIEYDAAGYPEATYLLGRIALASVFFYKDAPFQTEYASARDAVKIKTPSARLISDGPSNLHPGGRRAIFTFRGTLLGQQNAKVFSELLMFPRRDFYLTFRITYLASEADRARQEIDALVRGFKMP